MHLVRKSERTRFTAKEAAEIEKILEASSCRVLVYKAEQGMHGVHIEFSGPLAHFPSTSNSREIRWMNQPGGTRRPFISKSSYQRAHLEAATRAYTQALIDGGHFLPSFGSEPVSVMALFADKKGRWDSHNQTKPLGDWLEEIGLITDDAHADIDCKKQKSFSESLAEMARTLIVVQPFSQVQSLEFQTIQEMIQCSTGALKLVG